jgi:hypothetical protein
MAKETNRREFVQVAGLATRSRSATELPGSSIARPRSPAKADLSAGLPRMPPRLCCSRRKGFLTPERYPVASNPANAPNRDLYILISRRLRACRGHNTRRPIGRLSRPSWPGLSPANHVFDPTCEKDVDAHDKR